jgi:Mg2+/Co2+ transporter CorB
MLFPAFVLFLFFLLLSVFYFSSETSFISASPFKLDYLESKGIKRAIRVKKMLKKADSLPATILVGNTKE